MKFLALSHNDERVFSKAPFFTTSEHFDGRWFLQPKSFRMQGTSYYQLALCPSSWGGSISIARQKNKPCHTSKKWKDCTETNAQHKCITVFFLQLFVSFSWPFFLLQLSSLQSLTWLARMVLFYLFKRKNNWAMKNTLPSHCPGWFIGIPIMDNNPQENS